MAEDMAVKVTTEALRRRFGNPTMSDAEFNDLKREWLASIPESHDSDPKEATRG